MYFNLVITSLNKEKLIIIYNMKVVKITALFKIKT